MDLTRQAKESFGHLEVEEPWDLFYEKARSGSDLYPIKTHLPPYDSERAIYIIRDGRAAADSYAAYHDCFSPNPNFSPSVLDLTLGDDCYGHRSSHFENWRSRADGELLIVRFEDLKNADYDLLGCIKRFTGFKGELKPFVNPLNEQHSENPKFFTAGHTLWRRPEYWTSELEAFFIALHGELLLEFGYVKKSDLTSARNALDPLKLRLAETAIKGFRERNAWRHEAEEKESVIRELVARNSQRSDVV